MPNKMLIDSTHPEETRVVVLRGNRVEEFDFESANRKQLRGNIYLAKVTRVEPSLQAAFVDYGGNRHGFLAFSEIHPDYYQIPVADRQALIDEEERAVRAADAEADKRAGRRAERTTEYRHDEIKSGQIQPQDDDGHAMAAASESMVAAADHGSSEPADATDISAEPVAPVAFEQPARPLVDTSAGEPIGLDSLAMTSAAEVVPTPDDRQPTGMDNGNGPADGPATGEFAGGEAPAQSAAENGEPGANVTEVNSAPAEGEEFESVGGADAMEEVPERMPRSRRQYKIQEVIKRRQVMLVQVVKEERGTKGAALTTYLSLAGRYSVLMPNTARGGGISRKITSSEDRRKLKEIAQELEVPEGMGVILRTAGAARTKTEVKRDFEYLLRLWETVRDLTLKSTAPTLVYEEGSLIKRSIRDLYNKDIDEILVAGEAGYNEAKEFMRMLMPSHGKNVKAFRDSLPVFTRFGIEGQLDAMFQPVVQLRSGGYIVLNQTEALVAIDVNSGRATREHHIEDTALKTNVEAAEEIARQLRLRDLAGLIVIDFIDMDEKRNNRTVERRLKEALRHDRARIQVGHISHFGLLEMSRQRIRSSVLESSTEKCPHCGGSGHIRSVSSVSLQLLRSIEEMLLKGATHNLIVRTRTEIALYLLNHKRAHLRALEERFRITITVNADASIGGQVSYAIEKGEQVHSVEQAKTLAAQPASEAPVEDDADAEDEEYADAEEESAAEAEAEVEGDAVAAPSEALSEAPRESEQGEDGGRRRRRRGRGRRGGAGRDREGRNGSGSAREQAVASDDGMRVGESDPAEPRIEAPANVEPASVSDEPRRSSEPRDGGETSEDGEQRRRRRGRRGGRRNRRGREGEGEAPQGAADSGAAFEAELSVPGPDVRADAEPVFERREAEVIQHRQDESAQPSPQAPATPAPPAAVAPPRRRSTVREPAPGDLAGEARTSGPSLAPTHVTPSEPSQPVVPGTAEGDETGQPRRTGWWSRRSSGNG